MKVTTTVRSKELIKFETDEKIRLAKERAQLERQVSEQLHKQFFNQDKELFELQHSNLMEELEVYGKLIPMIVEMLKLQKELGPTKDLSIPDTEVIENLGKGFIKGIAEIEKKKKEVKDNNKLDNWR